ncbi:hypothetical protein IHP33_04075 [Enterococcus faecalis]|uniref:hypothetical protein n=1 Tax=Enterococcus faecalis TaxID=1351 RepID=UPI00177ECA34|nr:hypothetical protein [Enterococcus faecalis]MBD9844896.1 hypothetical protein [Enterococcus faecalis]
MKDMLTIFGVLVFICSLGLIVSHYQQTANNQDSTFLALNEVVKTEILENVSKGETRKEEGKMYLDTAMFEKDLPKKLTEKLSKEGTVSDLNFRYLKGMDEAIKAVRVKVKVGKKNYQTTVLVDIHKGLVTK